MMLTFLIKTFFKLISIIFEAILNAIIFLGRCIWWLLTAWIKYLIQRHKEKQSQKIPEKDIKNIETHEQPSVEETELQYQISQKVTDTVMYAIVRRNENGLWMQSNKLYSYDEARKIINEERKQTTLPRMIKKVYL